MALGGVDQWWYGGLKYYQVFCFRQGRRETGDRLCECGRRYSSVVFNTFFGFFFINKLTEAGASRRWMGLIGSWSFFLTFFSSGQENRGGFFFFWLVQGRIVRTTPEGRSRYLWIYFYILTLTKGLKSHSGTCKSFSLIAEVYPVFQFFPPP